MISGPMPSPNATVMDVFSVMPNLRKAVHYPRRPETRVGAGGWDEGGGTGPPVEIGHRVAL
jgi:hypothetical protein